MTMPIGMSDLRGIPPDKQLYWSPQSHDICLHDDRHLHYYDKLLGTTKDTRMKMKWYEMMDGSIVLTT